MSGLEVERRDGVSVARPEGDIDVANAALMREDLAACIDGSIDTLVIDLSATRYLDSAAIDMLLRLGALLGDRRATLMLVIPAESQLTRLAAIVGLGAAMPVHTSVAAALSANAERISSLPAAGSDAREMTPGTGPQ